MNHYSLQETSLEEVFLKIIPCAFNDETRDCKTNLYIDVTEFDTFRLWSDITIKEETFFFLCENCSANQGRLDFSNSLNLSCKKYIRNLRADLLFLNLYKSHFVNTWKHASQEYFKKNNE